MRYFGFLARFVVVPLIILRVLLRRDRHANVRPLPELTNWPGDKALLAHAAVAVAYTTIWDNYLVYSKIWGYDRKLVSGVRLGYVPIEEYTFFVLQPLMTGSLLLWLSRRIPGEPPQAASQFAMRAVPSAVLAAGWTASLAGLWRGGPRWRYMSLILSWALPPVMLQTAFGGDILWRHRKLIAAAVVPASIYLGAADSRAIRAGTWNISPRKTLGIDVIPHLPLEEFVFFCLTNLLLVFGVTLVMSKESERRLPVQWRSRYERFKSAYIGSGE
jgi:lycopene cyclase domain-containing protein